MSIAESFTFPPYCTGVLERCWRRAAAPAEWNLSEAQFLHLLQRSVARRFPAELPDHNTLESYLESLHAADLALAGACSAGNAAAWDAFVAQYRPELYRAGRAIAGESQGRELADSLYADLFGLHESDGRRKSLFEYFHGRSKLGTWLRAVLAQRHVDEIRRASRTDSLDESASDGRSHAVLASAQVSASGHHAASDVLRRSAHGAASASPHDGIPDPDRDRLLAVLQAALTAVLFALDPRDRLRLAYYYVDALTLAQIGKLLGEHEATVSRKLERSRRDVRKRVEAKLREQKALTKAQFQQCIEYVREDWPFDLTKVLSTRG